jgi:hypothetical protein
MLIVFIDIPRVIRKGLRRSGYVPLAKADGLHPSRTKVSQAFYPPLADKYEKCRKIEG